MKNHKIGPILLLGCIIPLILHGAKVGVLHLKAVGVATETAEAVAGLLVSDLTNYGHQVLNPEAIDATAGERVECYESGCAAEVGFKAKVERMIFGSVSRLGEKYIVQVSVVNVSTREVVWSGSLAAKSAEDLDTVVKRIAKAIAEGKKVEEGAEVGAITEQEVTQEVKRKETFYATGFNFIYGLPISGYAGASGLMGGSLINWYETPHFAVETGLSYFWSLNALTTSGVTTEPSVIDQGFNLSFFYLFSKEDFSPYVGGGLGPRFIEMKAGTMDYGMNFGMTFNAGGGLALLRTYDFHILIDGRIILNLAEIPHYEGPHGSFNFSAGIVYRHRGKGGCARGCGGGGCF